MPLLSARKSFARFYRLLGSTEDATKIEDAIRPTILVQNLSASVRPPDYPHSLITFDQAATAAVFGVCELTAASEGQVPGSAGLYVHNVTVIVGTIAPRFQINNTTIISANSTAPFGQVNLNPRFPAQVGAGESGTQGSLVTTVRISGLAGGGPGVGVDNIAFPRPVFVPPGSIFMLQNQIANTPFLVTLEFTELPLN